MTKKIVFGAIAALAAFYTVKMTLKMRHDLKRYNHILSLSDEGTVQEEFPELMLQLAKQETQALKELQTFARKVPKDVKRYMKIEAM